MQLIELKEILAANEIRLKKMWGQNFLYDEAILRDIVDIAEISKDDLVIEVGPGIGTMTEFLLKTGAKITAIEIDQRFCQILKDRFGKENNLEIVNANILKIDLKSLLRKKDFNALKVVSNLPYYITSPIIMYFLESGCSVKTMVFTMQEEVAARVTASPGSKDYGILTVIANYYSSPAIKKRIKSGSFFPAPKVDSAVVKFDVYDKPIVDVKDRAFFFKVVKTSFSQRRKTLKNNLSRLEIPGMVPGEIAGILAECGIDPVRRAETLSLKEFACICDRMGNVI